MKFHLVLLFLALFVAVSLAVPAHKRSPHDGYNSYNDYDDYNDYGHKDYGNNYNDYGSGYR